MARAVLAGLLVCLLALAGCEALADVEKLRSHLGAAGYDAGRIQHTTNNGTTFLSIAVVTDGEPTDEDAERIAEVAWKKFPREFERLLIWINASMALDDSHGDLLRRFGERPEGLTATDEGANPATVILIVAGVAVVFVALMVLVWHRGRRPPPPVALPPGYQPGGYPEYPPQPPQGWRR